MWARNDQIRLFAVAVGVFLAAPVFAQASGIGALSVDESEWYDTSFSRVRYELVLPEPPVQGEVFAVAVRGPQSGPVQGELDIQGELELPDGFIVTAHGWRAASGVDRLWYLLFGIPSTTLAGSANIRVTVHSVVGETRLLTGSTTIQFGSFISETIALNDDMSSLRSVWDPQKDEEARMLRELLHTTNRNARYHTGRFVAPLPVFRYTSYYGDRRTYAYSDGSTASGLHTGIDMAAPTGTPVAAAGRGRVAMATTRIVTGGTVIIEHLPAVYSIYYHLDTVDVEKGDFLEAGEILGTVGSTGLSTGPHLHWELRVAGVAVDPEQIIKAPYLDIMSVRRSLLTTP